MSESNNNIPMRITQLEEATAYEDGMYYAVAKAGSGTKKISADIVNNQINNLKSDLDYYTAIDKDNLLNSDTFIKNKVVVGGLIQDSDTYGYVKVNVTNGVKYISNTSIRRISGEDKESITTDKLEWIATYTGIAYFNYEMSRVISVSALYAEGNNSDEIGSYGVRALSSDIMAQTMGDSKRITVSQKTIRDVVAKNPTLSYTDGYYMDVNREIIYKGSNHKVSDVFYLAKGQRITFKANGYGSGVVSVFGETDETGNILIQSIVTSNGNNYQDVDYTATHNMFVRISILKASTEPTVIIYSNNVDLSSVININIIEVGAGKSFTSLISAINSIKDSSAKNQYEIHLYEGIYNTIEPEKINNTYYGLMIPDYVSIIGIGSRENIIISDECPSGYESYAHNISTLNFCDNGRLENVTVEAKNLRYCNHDDHMSANTLVVRHEYKDCVFKMKTIDSGFDVSGTCVGIGAMYDKQIIFERCDFINENNDNGNRCCVLLHDSSGRTGCVMTLDSCKFTGSRWNIKLSNNDALLSNIVTLKGNYFTQPILVTTLSSIYSNIFSIRAWGNKGFSYVVAGNLTDISADVDAYANEA